MDAFQPDLGPTKQTLLIDLESNDDTSLRWTVRAGPVGVHLRGELTVSSKRLWSLHNGPDDYETEVGSDSWH